LRAWPGVLQARLVQALTNKTIEETRNDFVLV
jgi:hypothetical protein